MGKKLLIITAVICISLALAFIGNYIGIIIIAYIIGYAADKIARDLKDQPRYVRNMTTRGYIKKENNQKEVILILVAMETGFIINSLISSKMLNWDTLSMTTISLVLGLIFFRFGRYVFNK